MIGIARAGARLLAYRVLVSCCSCRCWSWSCWRWTNCSRYSWEGGAKRPVRLGRPPVALASRLGVIIASAGRVLPAAVRRLGSQGRPPGRGVVV
jgi:hypothetical protein